MGRACSTNIGEMTNSYRMLVGISDERRLIGRHRSRWEDNIKTDLSDVGHEDEGCLCLIER
jgi:hypothetical protein